MARHLLRQEPLVNHRETIASRHKRLARKVGVGFTSQCSRPCCSRPCSSRNLELPSHSPGSIIIIIIDDVRVHEKDGTAAREVVVEADAGGLARGCGIDGGGIAIAAEI